MDHSAHNKIVSFIWSIADDCLRDAFVRGKYRDVILPMFVLRRLDCLLEPTKEAVLKEDDFQRKTLELADALTKEFGSGFSKRNLDYMRKFYLVYRDRATPIVQKPSAQSATKALSPKASGKSKPLVLPNREEGRAFERLAERVIVIPAKAGNHRSRQHETSHFHPCEVPVFAAMEVEPFIPASNPFDREHFHDCGAFAWAQNKSSDGLSPCEPAERYPLHGCDKRPGPANLAASERPNRGLHQQVSSSFARALRNASRYGCGDHSRETDQKMCKEELQECPGQRFAKAEHPTDQVTEPVGSLRKRNRR